MRQQGMVTTAMKSLYKQVTGEQGEIRYYGHDSKGKDRGKKATHTLVAKNGTFPPIPCSHWMYQGTPSTTAAYTLTIIILPYFCLSRRSHKNSVSISCSFNLSYDPSSNSSI